MKNLLACFFVIIAFGAHAEEVRSERINQAMEVIKSLCLTGGKTLEVKASGGGDFKISKITSSGVSGQVTLSYKELQGLIDFANEFNAKQASEMRACMRPYLDKIINMILENK